MVKERFVFQAPSFLPCISALVIFWVSVSVFYFRAFSGCDLYSAQACFCTNIYVLPISFLSYDILCSYPRLPSDTRRPRYATAQPTNLPTNPPPPPTLFIHILSQYIPPPFPSYFLPFFYVRVYPFRPRLIFDTRYLPLYSLLGIIIEPFFIISFPFL